MQFNQLIDRPRYPTLQSVVAGRRLDLIAPFARKGPLNEISPARHDRVRIIVRLPLPGQPLPARLDNDPRDLVDLAVRMGPAAKIYGLPSIHTKLYLNGASAFFGSANFTTTGFSGAGETLLRTDDPDTYAALASLFDNYLRVSQRLPLPFLRRLSTMFSRGDFDFTSTPEEPVILSRNPASDNEAVFRTWLMTLGEVDAQYIEDRFDPMAGYYMTGHTQSAFPGLRAFLRTNLDLIPALAGKTYTPYQFWNQNPETTARLRDFVRTDGHRYPARGGGPWRNKLPPFLGGAGQPGGGRGSGLIARMLIYLARFAIERGY